MNKHLSKTPSKSVKFYNLSEIRERRKLSPQPKISVTPKSFANTRNYAKVQGSMKSVPLPVKYSPQKNGVKPLSRNISPRPSWKPSGKPSEKPSFLKTSPKILPKKKGEINQEVSKIEVVKSPESYYPCLFVKNLLKKGEVFGTSLMNRIIRFITKDGKKSQASYFMSRVLAILAGFEADKKDSSEISSKSVKSDRKSQQNDKSGEVSPGAGPFKGSGDTDDKIVLKCQTYKSQKLSQFLSRQKLNFSEKSDKSPKTDVKSLKKNEGYSPLSPRFLIEQAISHVKPFVEVKKVRVAGSTYQVPAILEKHRQENYAIKWILQSALERHKKNPLQSFEYCLAFEIYEASKKQGQARMKRNELHKLAESHRAFAHFRWW